MYTAPVVWVTRAVLAGAYLGGRVGAYLTHTTGLDGAALCGRVKPESLADECATDTHAEPTCQTCRRRDPRFPALEVAP